MRNKLCLALLVCAFGCDKKETPPPVPQTAETPAAAPAPAAPAAAVNPKLLSPETFSEKAPESYKAAFSTTKGDFVIEVTRSWSPNGADRFYNLVKNGFYDEVAFFRVVKGFMAQFGIHGRPEVNAKWFRANIADDQPTGHSNMPGTVTFATSGPGGRSTHIFINYGNNSQLDGPQFTPIGKLVSGMEVVESLYAGYGDGPPYGNGVEQGRFNMEGNAYLQAEFPKLDYIKSAKLVP